MPSWLEREKNPQVLSEEDEARESPIHKKAERIGQGDMKLRQIVVLGKQRGCLVLMFPGGQFGRIPQVANVVNNSFLKRSVKKVCPLFNSLKAQTVVVGTVRA